LLKTRYLQKKAIDMQHIFNKDGFNWWIGVVEDRDDPEKIGRCRVRIFGYHTDSKDILSTKDLPWAVPIQPITSAATSGIGSSPLGPVTGTWVVGFFLDGNDMQQPAMFGTIATKAISKGYDSPESKKEVENTNDGVLKDGNGGVVTDGDGRPVRTGVPEVPGWVLGSTSEKYETSGKGPGTINDYKGAAKGDFGGASYGTYQFTSFLPSVNEATGKARPVRGGTSPVEIFVKNSKFKTRFEGLVPATSEFDSAWKQCASSDGEAFKNDQHDYIKRKYYEVMLSGLQRRGIDLSNFGPGVQDLIWSTAVQYGPASTTVFTTPLNNKSQLTDKDIITLVCDFKINTVDEYFKSSSANIRQGIKSRLQSEKNDLLNLVKA